MNGFTDRSVTVKLLGGELKIVWDEQTNHVQHDGPDRLRIRRGLPGKRITQTPEE